MSSSSRYKVAIIGAGAAGIAASQFALKSDIEHVVIEASHRIGGRGLTESLGNGIPVDMGCHWMHSATINPYVTLAKAYGYTWFYDAFKAPLHLGHAWASKSMNKRCADYFQRCYSAIDKAGRENQDVSMIDVIDTSSEYFEYFNYYQSLNHSTDLDQVSVMDHVSYEDTGENWPVVEGFGSLIQRHGQGLPITLNCPVSAVNHKGNDVHLTTPRGEITAQKLIITVSNGIINAGDILFTPELSEHKLAAFADLPMGHYNNLFFELKKSCIDPDLKHVALSDNELFLYIKFRPYDQDYVFTSVAGRFAAWLEGSGEMASKDYFSNALVKVLGSDIVKSLGQFKSSAWTNDQWVKGAFSAARPGRAKSRFEIARPINEKLYFAGEATIPQAHCSVHGAHLSGERAMRECIQDFN